jgi:cell division protein FtsB
MIINNCMTDLRNILLLPYNKIDEYIIQGGGILRIKRILILNVFLVVSLGFAGCSGNSQTELGEMKLEVVRLQENSETLRKDIENLEAENSELKSEISKLEELINLNDSKGDLTDLTLYEEAKYEEFKASYDEGRLVGLGPLSVCKLYLYAASAKDYETTYELYTKNENYVQWSKEEDRNFPESDRIKDFEVYKDVYDLNIQYSGSDEEHAAITWKSRNGDSDEKLGAYTYGFSLVRDGDIWKVNFLPIQ